MFVVCIYSFKIFWVLKMMIYFWQLEKKDGSYYRQPESILNLFSLVDFLVIHQRAVVSNKSFASENDSLHIFFFKEV